MNEVCYIEPPGYIGDIDSFHEWLLYHPKLAKIGPDTWSLIFHGLRKSERIHYGDVRKGTKGEAYIVHPIRMVLGYIEKYKSILPESIIVLMLHDTIEDHPACWRIILETFGLSIFRDVIVLSRISKKYRKEMLEYFMEGDIKPLIVGEIFQILSPVDPLFKLRNQSNYVDSIDTTGAKNIGRAIEIYRRVIIDKKKKSREEKDDYYISLGNYLYFTPEDARRKVQDMLDNMRDMEEMELRKPGYKEERRIKAYILGVKLQYYGMQAEYIELQNAFHEAVTRMLTDADVINYDSLSDPLVN